MKVEFKDLSWWLKVAVVYAFFDLGLSIVWFFIGFVSGIVNGV